MPNHVGSTAIEIAADVRAGRIDALKVVEAHLEHIERLQPDIGAFRVIRRQAALSEAEALAKRDDLDSLPLAGVPVAIKDNVDVAAECSLHGCAATATTPSTEDHLAVRRLREAGAIVVGKTTLPEFGIWPMTDGSFGTTRNPWNIERGVGGSSGGAAAAVASGAVPIAVGNDGAGSIRIPSAVCGTFGIKPGQGVVPTLDQNWFGMTDNGPITTTVEDAALALAVMSGRAELAEANEPDRRLNVAFSTRPPLKGLHVAREVKQAVVDVAEAFERAGHNVDEDDPPYNASARTAAISRWLAGPLEGREGLDKKLLEKRTRAHLRAGRVVMRLHLVKDAQVERWVAKAGRMFDRYDVVLTPTVARTALPVGPWSDRSWLRNTYTALNFAPFTGLWNLAPFPAASVPAAMSADGLPIGVQVIAGPGKEGVVLAVSKQLEGSLRWPRHASSFV